MAGARTSVSAPLSIRSQTAAPGASLKIRISQIFLSWISGSTFSCSTLSTPGRTIPEGDFSHSLGLPQRSVGYPRSPFPTHAPTLKELSMEFRRWTGATPANGPSSGATLRHGENELPARIWESHQPSFARLIPRAIQPVFRVES